MGSDKYKKLIQALRAATKVEFQPLFNATVKEITGDSCTVMYGDLELTEVRLKATIDGNEQTLMLVPVLGSNVLIGSLTGDFKDLAVLRADELDKIILDVKTEVSLKAPKATIEADDVKLKSGKVAIDADSIVMNGGENMGLAKVLNIAQQLNLIELDINALKAIFSTAWVPVPSDGGAALKAAAGAWAGKVLATTMPTVLENSAVKH